MKTIRTADTAGTVLDWLVAKCEGKNPSLFIFQQTGALAKEHSYSTDWPQGGPIIEREGIGIAKAENGEDWIAMRKYNLARDDSYWCGPTPLIAAMRCYVMSKLGDTVEVPEELA